MAQKAAAAVHLRSGPVQGCAQSATAERSLARFSLTQGGTVRGENLITR
jgi:hypothetical protein